MGTRTQQVTTWLVDTQLDTQLILHLANFNTHKIIQLQMVAIVQVNDIAGYTFFIESYN